MKTPLISSFNKSWLKPATNHLRLLLYWGGEEEIEWKKCPRILTYFLLWQGRPLHAWRTTSNVLIASLGFLQLSTFLFSDDAATSEPTTLARVFSPQRDSCIREYWPGCILITSACQLHKAQMTRHASLLKRLDIILQHPMNMYLQKSWPL